MVDFSKYLKKPLSSTIMIKKVYADEETTGTDPMRHGLIQIAMRNYRDREPVDEPLVLKIQPFKTDIIEDTALEVNGVTREELFSSDRMEPKEAYQEIMRY